MRGALELAVAVARSADDHTTLPEGLAPILSFRRLTGASRRVVLAALDDDDFRATVAADEGAADLDAASQLVLGRPTGWASALDAIDRARTHEADTAAAATERDRLQRRLDAAEAARDRAEDRARAAAEQVERSRAAADEAKAAAGRARQDRTEALGRASNLEAQLVSARESLTETRRALEDARRGRREAEAALADAVPPLDIDDTRRALTSLADHLRALGVEADHLGALLEPQLRARQDQRDRVPTRTPVPPPAGLDHDHPTAVTALLRTPGLVVLVDGYNVTIGRQGSNLSIAEQRRWLEARAGRLAARVPGEIHLVFDGDGTPSAGGGRTALWIHYTPEVEEADDRILAMIDARSVDTPVAVVSDDARVRDGARRRGANVLGTDAFVQACG